MKILMPLALGAALAAGSASVAQGQSLLLDAIKGGTVKLDLRYRLELVNQDGIARDATASTLRTKFSYRTGSFEGFSAFLEFDNVFSLGKTKFNDTLNGKTRFPVVADPEATEVNQAYLSFANKKMSLTAGRRGINLGEQRWIGTVGFRQNDQTFDGVVASFKPRDDISVIYAYIFNVNRIFSDDHPNGDLDTNSHLFQVDYTASDLLHLRGFAYLLDIQETGLTGLSSASFGARASGKYQLERGVAFGYVLEYARQSDYKSSALDYRANYFSGEGSIAYEGVSLKAGYELLGSDNGVGLKTPLATLHKFNGWADVFLATPAAGLEDISVSAGYALPKSARALGGLKIIAVYHDFSSDTGGLDYGHEFGWLISYPINGNFSASIKGAHYRTDGFATDRDKIWFTLGAKF